MIMIGRLAEKYGMLPSQVIANATSFDLMIYDVLATFDEYQRQKAEGNVDPDLYGFTDEELAIMHAKAKESK